MRIKPSISIIVPIYNSSATIGKTIESILRQSYVNFELLLVDDGSYDDSFEICQSYAQKDSRIKIYRKPNGGASSARNVGLLEASGEWITFVDSDDLIDIDFLDILISFKSYDFIVCGCTRVNNNSEESLIPPDGLLMIDNNPEADNIFSELYFTTPWAKLFKNSIISSNCIRFNVNLYLGEDTDFVFRYLQYIRNIYLINKPLYVYNELSTRCYSMTANDYDNIYRIIIHGISSVERRFSTKLKKTRKKLLTFYFNVFLDYLDRLSYLKHREEVHKFRNNKSKVYADSFKKKSISILIYFSPLLFIIRKCFKGNCR